LVAGDIYWEGNWSGWVLATLTEVLEPFIAEFAENGRGARLKQIFFED
jgi:hypothetical protein